jgi:hypothetical protein
MKKILSNIYSVFTAYLEKMYLIQAVGWLFVIGGYAIHLWTILIALKQMGVLMAILTLILPGIAEVYWFIRMIIYHGTLMNPYCLVIIGYLLYQLSQIAWAVISVKMEEEDDDRVEPCKTIPDSGVTILPPRSIREPEWAPFSVEELVLYQLEERAEEEHSTISDLAARVIRDAVTGKLTSKRGKRAIAEMYGKTVFGPFLVEKGIIQHLFRWEKKEGVPLSRLVNAVLREHLGMRENI